MLAPSRVFFVPVAFIIASAGICQLLTSRAWDLACFSCAGVLVFLLEVYVLSRIHLESSPKLLRLLEQVVLQGCFAPTASA